MWPLAPHTVTKPVLADVAAGVDHDAVADMRMRHGAIGFLSRNPFRSRRPDRSTAWAPIKRTGADFRRRPDHRERIDYGVAANPAVGCTMAPGETPTVSNTEIGRSAPP